MGVLLNKNSKLLISYHSLKEVWDIDIVNNQNYKNLLKNIDIDKWYYTNKKIKYSHNEYGYRSDNLSSIEHNDYLLTFGCSYSYGNGLFYEDTYAYKLSNKLNLKNVNLSVPGSSIKVQQYNTNLFINSFINIRLPKYVVYQYPHDYRVSLSKFNGNFLDITTKTAMTDEYKNEEYVKKYYIENSGEKYLQDLLVPLYLNNIWKAYNVPVFHITFSDYNQEYKSDFQKFEILDIINDIESEYPDDKYGYLYDLARDLSHNGIKFHDKVYNVLLNKINNG
jgi:hypothetical protein